MQAEHRCSSLLITDAIEPASSCSPNHNELYLLTPQAKIKPSSLPLYLSGIVSEQ